jgi:hypothetical protein
MRPGAWSHGFLGPDERLEMPRADRRTLEGLSSSPVSLPTLPDRLLGACSARTLIDSSRHIPVSSTVSKGGREEKAVQEAVVSVTEQSNGSGRSSPPAPLTLLWVKP